MALVDVFTQQSDTYTENLIFKQKLTLKLKKKTINYQFFIYNLLLIM